MSSFKKLNKADVTTVPYAANKQWDLNYTTTVNDSYAVFSRGKNEPFNITGSKTTNNQYQSLVYSTVNHLFYQAYTASLNTGSLMFNVNTYTSASQYRPTSSYFNYNTNPLLIKQFPTATDSVVGVLSVNQDVFGSKILPGTFNVSASGIVIKDDGNGNLYDIAQALNQYIDLNWVTLNYVDTGSLVGTGIEFVGNIFYAHGIAVVTNQAPKYISIFELQTHKLFSLVYSPSGTSIYNQYNYVSSSGEYITEYQLPIYFPPPSPRLRCINTSYPSSSFDDPSYTNKFNGFSSTGITCSPSSISTKISFKNEHIIHENEVRCIIKESEYNVSYNPTLLQYKGQYIVSGSSGYTLTGSFDSTLKEFATGSDFSPYMTTIGLYNDDNDLLMVAKIAKPIVISPDTDMTFIVKYDI